MTQFCHEDSKTLRFTKWFSAFFVKTLRLCDLVALRTTLALPPACASYSGGASACEKAIPGRHCRCNLNL